MSGAVLRAAVAFRWYVRQLTGEGKWDEYVARCRERGDEPMTRRAFERHWDKHRESNPQARCC